MSYIRNLVDRVRRGGEEGATAVEYGVMIALIAAVIVLVVLFLGQQVKSGFCDTTSALAEGGADSQVTADNDCEPAPAPS